MSCGEPGEIFVFGASGHARVVIDAVERQGLYRISCLVDDDPALRGSTFFGYPVLGSREELVSAPGAPRRGIVAIGSNRARSSVAAWLCARGFQLVSVVHPSAQLGRGVVMGSGTVVLAGAVINSGAVLGSNVVVNTRASVDHDCLIADGVHLAPGSTLCGTVRVGEGSFVCAGATVIPNLTIGKEATVGAGAAVVREVADGVTVAGVPARPLRRKE